MALNKFMHPRNIYKNPPDFANLAKEFPDFAKIAKTDVTGKVSIDFRDANALRILTKCLLMADFNLKVDIPSDRLVPTLPLRLNYILWIEDLMASINREENIIGLDIGTGACAIYPLLAASKNKWKMVATDTDDDSLKKAEENIRENELSELIQLSKNSTDTVIDYLFHNEDKLQFDFCMCNPPFYSNIEELYESRSPARPPPKNCFTGSPQELITEGGELQFCRKIIEESLNHKDKILIFTTMIGHKYNLKELILDLKAEGIRYTQTEFCQGRVTRWGLAWTFQNYDLQVLVPARDKPRKKCLPTVVQLPNLQITLNDFDAAKNKLKNILNNLDINNKVLNKRGNLLCLEIEAHKNTWSNQRRKRRLLKLQELEAKKHKSSSMTNMLEDVGHEKLLKDEESTKSIKSEEMNAKNTEEINELSKKTSSVTNDNEIACVKTKENGIELPKTIPNVEINCNVICHAFLKIIKKDNEILLECEFLDGTAGKEGLHQIVQYIKNNWK